MSSTTRVDLSKIERAFSQSELRAKQEAFARRVAFETRDYVPEDSGALKGSEPLASDYETGLLEWATPYAKRVNEMPASSIRKESGTGKSNPKATSGWFDAAKAERLDAWETFARNLMGGRS